MKFQSHKIFNIIFLICILFISFLHAQIPRTLSYQGILTDNAGKPRPDQDYQFTFCLYDTAIGSSPLWTEQKILSVKSGLFSTVLGDQKPFSAAVKFDKQYWLGIQVASEAELAPRIRLTSVGYSLYAVRADTANVALNSKSRIFTGAIVADLTQNSGTSGRDGFILRASPDNSAGVLLVNKPGFYLYSESEQRAASLTCNQIDANGIVSHNGVIVVDLTLNSGTSGRDGFILRASPDNSAGVLLVNKPGFYLYSESEQRAANLVCNDLISQNTSVSVLTIRGGSDIAEPFEISLTDSLPVGSLVVIDPEQPGKLKQATEPYDKRVAGVISGAGGINPGLTLTQEGKLAGSQHVALTGKVYALATVANGAIKPGDLLTTSSIPGHAMKATDKEVWPGAVIGKAMSGLKEGEGLVLVLVNLQ